MINVNFSRRIKVGSMTSLIIQVSVAVIMAFGLALLMHDTWVKSLNVYHTILELICVFIALAIFSAVWFTYNRNSSGNQLLGFGYLAIAIFDSLHTFYHLKLSLSGPEYFDLSSRYWMIGRLTEAIIILLYVSSVKIKLNKWILLIFTIMLANGISNTFINYHDFLPVLLTEQGVTLVKVVLEYVVIGLYLVSIYKLRNKLGSSEIITNRYLFIALIVSVFSELSFTLYSSVNSISWTIGHFLKITAYYCLFRGVFVSTVTYPYKELEDKNQRLQEKNQELKSMKGTLKDILDVLPIGIQKLDRNGRVKYMNRKLEEMIACSREQVIGLTADEFVQKFSREEKDEENLFIRTIKEGKETRNIIRTYKNLRGEKIKLLVNSHKITNGVLIRFEEAKKQQELQDLHLQTETILNSVTNSILMFDVNKRIVQCNKANEETLEINKESIVGMNIDELNKLIDFSSKDLPDVLLSGYDENETHEVSLTSFKGNRRDLMVQLATIRNVDGEVIGGISVGTDITETKKQQEKMIQQEKLALLGQMGAGIVHETRNYLTTIKGRCQLIGMLGDNEKVKEHAVKINNEVDEVNKIISEFLFLSKPREVELEEISMLDIFESIKSMIGANSLVKGVDVEFGFCREERYLLCDEGQLKQVILNICKNAVDAMSERLDAKLRIETLFDEVANEMIIKITDNGNGISQEDLKKIGTPFFTTKKTGTGLGLNVCYKIIKDHGGRIDVESRLGEGTTFTIVLPCIEDEELDEVV